jgi:flagellar basal body-associated protein FliL
MQRRFHVAGEIRGDGRKEGYNILLIFLLMLLLNIVIFISLYVIVFRPFEIGASDSKNRIGPMHKLESFIVDVGNFDIRKGCKADIVLELKDNKALKEVNQREAEIRSVIINVLRLNTIQLLMESNDTTILQNLITEELNEVLGGEKVKTTWFTEFIVD